MTVFPAEVTSLAAALGIGLLVGLERERKKLRNDGAREPAGLRTFASQLGKVTGAEISAAARAGILSGNLKRLLEPILKAKGLPL